MTTEENLYAHCSTREWPFRGNVVDAIGEQVLYSLSCPFGAVFKPNKDSLFIRNLAIGVYPCNWQLEIYYGILINPVPEFPPSEEMSQIKYLEMSLGTKSGNFKKGNVECGTVDFKRRLVPHSVPDHITLQTFGAPAGEGYRDRFRISDEKEETLKDLIGYLEKDIKLGGQQTTELVKNFEDLFRIASDIVTKPIV